MTMWGLTASDSQRGYIAWGAPPREPAAQLAEGESESEGEFHRRGFSHGRNCRVLRILRTVISSDPIT